MTTITLEAIEKQQSALAEMIERFKAQPCDSILFPETEIMLKPVEHYAGVITGRDGEASYHLILLAGEATEINWKDAIEWAAKIGGTLPNRREQSLLYANLKPEFSESWYWSGEAHESDASSAWCQYFHDGTQSYGRKYGPLRCRAVRRLVIE